MVELYFLIVCFLLVIACVSALCRSRNNQEEINNNLQIRISPPQLVRIYQQNSFNDEDIENAIAISNETYNEEIEQRFSKLKIIKANEHPNYKEDFECFISMEPIEEEEEIYLIKCKHVFKKEVLMDWLKKKWECPFCRETDLEVDE